MFYDVIIRFVFMDLYVKCKFMIKPQNKMIKLIKELSFIMDRRLRKKRLMYLLIKLFG